MTNDITTLLLVLAPAALVLAASYTVLRKMIEADQRRRATELHLGARKETLQIRLHAMEQLVVLMERFAPTELVLRNTRNATTTAELHALLLDIVRKEMEAYLSCQLYVSLDTWQLIVSARNELVSLINRAAAEVPPNEPAIRLSKAIIETLQADAVVPTTDAIDALRKEAKRLFT
jgi:hypothetical protein